MSGEEWKPPPLGVAKAANRLIRPLLRSRFHAPLSKRLMLLEYTGHRSGLLYTVPVGYRQWGKAGDEVLATSIGTSWPLNLRGGQPVRLRIKGRWYTAKPTIVERREDVAALLEELAGRQGPAVAASLKVGLPKDRQPTREELLSAGGRVRIGRFRLSD